LKHILRENVYLDILANMEANSVDSSESAGKEDPIEFDSILFCEMT